MMGLVPRVAVAAGGGLLLASAGVLGSGVALAAQSTEPIDCDGHALTIRVNNNNSSDHGGWSVAQIWQDGHLIPVAFSGSAYDETIGETIFEFSQSKGGGHANHNQPTVTCTQQFTATLADFLDPGESAPPGTSLDDVVTFTFTAAAVRKG